MTRDTKRRPDDETVHYVSDRKKRSKQRPTRAIQPPLTPMIDVTFLLLVFFLLACRFRVAEGQILAKLPDISGPDVAPALKTKPILDPLVVVRLDSVGRYWKGKGRHKLDAVARRLGVKRDGNAHRASSDAKLTAMVLHELASHLPSDAHEAAEIVARARDEQDAQFQAWRATQPKEKENA